MQDYVTCPGCKVDVALPVHTLLGQLVACSDCGVKFEVLSLGPFIPDLGAIENWEEPKYRVTVSSFLSSASYPI